MCFHVHQDHQQPKTATRSIRVWKRFRPGLISPYLLFRYELGKEYRSEMVIKPRFNDSRCSFDPSIEQGLHSYSSMRRAHYVSSFSQFTELVLECTVPKGSTYYWNPQMQEIVSDRLVIKTIKSTRELKTKRSFPSDSTVRTKPKPKPVTHTIN